jgi:hypothetical protein
MVEVVQVFFRKWFSSFVYLKRSKQILILRRTPAGVYIQSSPGANPKTFEFTAKTPAL